MKNVFNLAVKLVFQPYEGLRETIEKKPFIPALLLFILSNIIVVAITMLIKNYSLQDIGLISKLVFSKIFIPFLSIFIIHLLSKIIFNSAGDLKTFSSTYLLILASTSIVLSLANILFYTIFILSHSLNLLNSYNFIIMLAAFGWILVLTVAAIMNSYALTGKQAVSIWAIQYLPFIIFYLLK